MSRSSRVERAHGRRQRPPAARAARSFSRRIGWVTASWHPVKDVLNHPHLSPSCWRHGYHVQAQQWQDVVWGDPHDNHSAESPERS